MTRGTLERVHAPPVRVAWLAERWMQRLRGLLFRKPLEEDGSEALVIRPCSSIHTVGMRYPLDIVFLDHEDRICGLRRSVSPWRATAEPGAKSTVEFHAGAIEKLGLNIGEPLVWKPVPSQ